MNVVNCTMENKSFRHSSLKVTHHDFYRNDRSPNTLN